jgi:hypothetical protein
VPLDNAVLYIIWESHPHARSPPSGTWGIFCYLVQVSGRRPPKCEASLSSYAGVRKPAQKPVIRVTVYVTQLRPEFTRLSALSPGYR